MRRFNPRALFPLLALIIMIFALSIQLFNVFPLGKILNPFTGVVRNGTDIRLQEPLITLDKAELKSAVQIFFDDRRVPHLFAGNQHDLYFAQGYVTAYLRLWQMDFMAYNAAGRLSEILDPGIFLEYDRNQRRMGIPTAAAASLALMEKDPETDSILAAYTNGVNSYIRELNKENLPLEYKLLDYIPEPWTKLKSVLILKYMASTMTGYNEDVMMSKMALALGDDYFNKLFPDFNGHISPVMDNGHQDAERPLTPFQKPVYLDYNFMSSGSVIKESGYNPRLGSNSWAVSGKKTKSGYPILANDPHLNLSLPCIWVEMQLSAPGLNAYGVSIPGTPAFTIGFNNDIAWGITNGADDVKDWYKLKLSADYKKYKLDDKWMDLQYRIDTLRRKGQSPLCDTIYTTVYGPIVMDSSFHARQPDLDNHALHWELQRPSNEFKTFIRLAAAKNYTDYKNAIAYFSSPVQNFTFACRDNTIAINHQGSMAVKERGEGRFIMDGTKSTFATHKYIPADSLPQLLNPTSNYVLSANQHPTYADYPYYYNGYYSEVRANRIKKLLEKDTLFDIAAMQAMQLDNTSDLAVTVLPLLLANVRQSALSPQQHRLLGKISTWQGAYNEQDESARLFELWWKRVETDTWDELQNYAFYLRPPDAYILADMISTSPDDKYFDKMATAARESAADIITAAFIAATTEYEQLETAGRNKWGQLNRVDIMHLTGIPALSRTGLPSAGHPDAINAASATWGPSWRMVVELDERPRAYGIYPGGQSGNAGSPYYDNFIKDWNKGKYYPLNYFLTSEEARPEAVNTWILKPGQ